MSADFKQSEPGDSSGFDASDDYPYWASALSVALDVALNPTSATDRDVALRCLVDYRAWRDAKAMAAAR